MPVESVTTLTSSLGESSRNWTSLSSQVVRLKGVVFQMIKQSADFGLSFTKTHYYYDFGMTNKRAQVNQQLGHCTK